MSSADEAALHGSLGLGQGWDCPDLVTHFDANARTTFTSIKVCRSQSAVI